MYYFAFGSNMDQGRMRSRCGNGFSGRVGAVLQDYLLVFNKQATGKTGIGYANVMARAHSDVHGIIYQISDECSAELDAR